MGWTEIVAGLIRAFNLIAGWARDAGLRRQGWEKAELESLRHRETVRRKSDDIDNAINYAPGPDGDRDILKRL